MTTRARTALTAGVLALALVVMGAGLPAKNVPPNQWTGGLCTKLDTWRSVAVDGARQLSTELSGAQVSLSEARTALVAYLGDVEAATAQAGKDIKALGAPDTAHGRTIEQRVVRLFKQLHGSTEDLQHRARGLSTTKERVALRQVRSIQNGVNGVFNTFSKEFKRLKRLDEGHKIDKAFAASAACRTATS